MSRLDLALIDAAGMRVPVPTSRASGVEMSTGRNGYQDLTAFLPLPDAAAFALANSSGLRAVLYEAGSPLWEGRVEDLRLVPGGVQVAALGDWRAFEDDLYTALWSASGTERWQETSNAVTGGVLTNRRPEMYEFQMDEVIQISPVKGASYATGADVGSVFYRGPNGGADRAIVGMQFRLRLLLPSNWRFQINAYTNNDWSGGLTTPLTVTSAGALIDRAYHISGFGRRVWELFIFNNTGGASAPAGETGSWYALISDIRIITSAANRVNTTLTANRAAGASVTATVGSTAGMYVGMQLVINSGNTPSEIVTVESVTSATQFVATFVGSYVAGNAVQGHQVTADEIVRDVRDQINTLNAGSLSTSNRLITNPGLDLLNALYQDDSAQDVLARLAELGDAAGNKYEVGVWEGREVFFRQAGSGGRAWAVDASELEIEQSIDGLVNSTYGTYEDQGGRTLRTANQTSPQSIARFGRTRRRRVDADTTNATLAARVAATATAATATPVPRAKVSVRRFATPAGVTVSGSRVRAGDTITIRNLTPTAGDVVDRIRTFRVAETQYDVDNDAPEIVPETPTPDLDYQIALTVRRARQGQ